MVFTEQDSVCGVEENHGRELMSFPEFFGVVQDRLSFVIYPRMQKYDDGICRECSDLKRDIIKRLAFIEGILHTLYGLVEVGYLA